MKQKTYVIYGLFDPETNELRYIGKTHGSLNKRFKDHLKEALVKSTYKCRWINSLLKQNKVPLIQELEKAKCPESSIELEEFYIDYFRSLGCKLTNAQNGGVGSPGRVVSEETRDKVRQKALERGPTGVPSSNKKDNQIIDGIEHRNCFNCKKYIKLDCFYINKKDGWIDSWCRECRKIQKQEKRKIKPDSVNYVKLSPEEYKASRIAAARKGGETIANSPEKRAAISAKKSKPIIAQHVNNNTILEFPSALKAKEQGFHNKLIGDAIKSGRPYKNYYWKLK